MDTILARYRNVSILVAVLFLQVIGLAVQVKRPSESGPTRLIRVLAVGAITPLEKGVLGVQHAIGGAWSNYVWLRGVRQENAELRDQIERLRLEQVRLAQDAAQAHRLQALLAFKEQFLSQTVAAQVIGSSGSEQSRIVYIDKGSRDGIKPDMAVLTPQGIVGKVIETFHGSSRVLLITDASSGVGVILTESRLQGVLKGTQTGETIVHFIMSDEKVAKGEPVLTSGGDRVFPKGLLIGAVTDVSQGPDLFLNIRVKPAAELSKLEEVLVITHMEEKQVESAEAKGPVRAADVLAQRLPTLAKPAQGGAIGAGASHDTGIPLSSAEFARQQKEQQKEKEKGSRQNSSPVNGTPATATPNSRPPDSKPSQVPPKAQPKPPQPKQVQPDQAPPASPPLARSSRPVPDNPLPQPGAAGVLQ